MLDKKDWIKDISIAKLREILSKLDDAYLIIPNPTGNLTAVNKDLEYIGYIDLMEDKLYLEEE